MMDLKAKSPIFLKKISLCIITVVPGPTQVHTFLESGLAIASPEKALEVPCGKKKITQTSTFQQIKYSNIIFFTPAC